MSSELRLRLRKVREGMREARVGAFYVTRDVDVLYLSGQESGRILVTDKDAILWVKDIYEELYDATYSSAGYPLEVREYDKEKLEGTLRGLRKKAIGVCSYDAAAALRKVSGKRSVVADVVKSARSVKTKHEIELIRRSCNMAKAGMRKAREVVRKDVRELDAVAEVEAELRRRGSEKAPFGSGMLLASGRFSSDIHAKASLRRIQRGTVVVDLGACHRGYFSDMTRTLMVGAPTVDERRVMESVRNLRDETIDYIRPGMLASEVHRHVEGRISGLGFNFYHLTGHGVGLEVHESPSFSPDSKVKLRDGMVFTVEPGIYVPKKFGVRFEDTVLLTRNGCKKLT
ncbi:MAG: Xaa-Pro peptidase family protein [Candidatus Altiarchaeota archaeon]